MTLLTRKAARGWYILRYHRPSQLAARLLSIVRRRYEAACGAGRDAPAPASLPTVRHHAGLERIARARLESRAAEAAAADRLLEGRYCFLHVERELPDPIDWRLECWPDAPHLWRFHLHYHEFLLDLAAEGHFGRAWEIVCQWIENNPLRDPRVRLDAWHPYCISRRLPVWISLWTASPPGGQLRGRILAGMQLQADDLANHLERDLGGNHLLENLRALMLAGCFLDGPEAARWREEASRWLRRELAAQILPHSEHFERSPMYHAAMLDAVLDIRDAAEGLVPETARLAAEAAEKMSGFLKAVLHPDGQIPLLGDSCFGETPLPARLLQRAAAQDEAADLPPGHATDWLDRKSEGSTQPHARASGLRLNEEKQAARAMRLGDYWVYRDEESFVLLDAGPVGADHLPAHAHADLLSFEASFRGARLLVDSGVASYEDDAMRRYCRSTAAHNVLEIDGENQCDMWSKFRMGYRGWPSGLIVGQTDGTEKGDRHRNCSYQFSSQTTIGCGASPLFQPSQTGGFSWARACHNAYRRLGVPVVGRWFACRPGGPWLCVDWAEGKGTHRCTNRLHLHPEVAVEQTVDGELTLRVAGAELRLRFFTPGEVTVSEAWYCPAMGCRQPAPVICWTATATLPAVCGWSLAWGADRGTAVLQDSKRNLQSAANGLETRSTGWRLRWRDEKEETDLWAMGEGDSS